MNLTTVRIDKPDEVNIILGQAHFIRTVEDLHEALATSVPGAKFGVAFCEASGPRLLRHSGTDPELEALAVKNLQAIGAGHTFLVTLGNLFPIHALRAVREVPEVCRIFCATANPVEVVVAESPLGRGVLGVIDGGSPLGVEGPKETAERVAFLRKIGLKLG
ncbi:MAG: adenosine-specific kinase [Deltaproteobacteria bacterium]|nr:adenosine-specific kinase [Deltaproteobacteria bacterium]